MIFMHLFMSDKNAGKCNVLNCKIMLLNFMYSRY